MLAPLGDDASDEEVASQENGLRNLEAALRKLPEPRRSQALQEFYPLAGQLRAAHRQIKKQRRARLN